MKLKLFISFKDKYGFINWNSTKDNHFNLVLNRGDAIKKNKCFLSSFLVKNKMTPLRFYPLAIFSKKKNTILFCTYEWIEVTKEEKNCYE